MARRFAQKKQPFDEPNEKNDNATSGREHEDESKTVESRINPAEGHICRGKFHRRKLDQPAVFVIQGNMS